MAAQALSTTPIVSVLMPVWNGERYLQEAIESVLAQTYRQFELLIVDDGSEDRTAEIIDRHAAAEPRVRVLHLPHRGLVPSLNAGCAAARGKYIARLDADDVALPQRLEKQVEFLDAHPRVAMVGSAFRCIGATGQRTNVVVHPPGDPDTIRYQLRQSNPFCHSAVMMRTDAVAAAGGYREAFARAQDYDLWTRLADGHDLASLAIVLVLYRLHANQVSVTRLEDQAFAALAVRLSTEHRRRTGMDPLADVHTIDEATLLRLGVDEEEIRQQLVENYVSCLSLLPRLGMSKVALQVLRHTMHTIMDLERAPVSASTAVANCSTFQGKNVTNLQL